MERTSGLPLELKATLHARSPTRTRSTSHQLIAGDALYAAPDTLPRSGFVHGRNPAAVSAPESYPLSTLSGPTIWVPSEWQPAKALRWEDIRSRTLRSRYALVCRGLLRLDLKRGHNPLLSNGVFVGDLWEVRFKSLSN